MAREKGKSLKARRDLLLGETREHLILLATFGCLRTCRPLLLDSLRDMFTRSEPNSGVSTAFLGLSEC